MSSADIASPSQWLDTVWSLGILDRATPENYEYVVDKTFINQLTGFQIGNV